MRFKVMSWNMAGAKLLEQLDSPPDNVAKTYIQQYNSIWNSDIRKYLSFPGPSTDHPDVILLQECIGFTDTRFAPTLRWQSGKEILQAIFPGYECFFFPAFSSQKNPNPARWKKLRSGSGIPNFLPDYIDAQQGYGVCIRDPNQLKRIWIDEKTISDKIDQSHIDDSLSPFTFSFEAININTGLYLGNRDTEPRLVILGRLKLIQGSEERYCNFINLHLTTLKGEREGNLRLNRLGSKVRLQQLDLIFYNIISAYQESNNFRIPRKTKNRKDDIWIIGGDFNATPESDEFELIQKSDLIDGNSDKRMIDLSGRYNDQIGTKISLSDPNAPPIVVDYLFCGFQSSSFPINGVKLGGSRRPYLSSFPNSKYATDHAVLFSIFDL